MAPKTFQNSSQESNGSNEEFDDKFEDLKEEVDQKKEVNQNLSTSKENQIDLTIDNQQESNDKILNFGWNLRNDIMNHAMELTALLDGRFFDPNDRKDLLATNGDLIRRLSFLSFGGNAGEFEGNLKLIDNDLLNYLSEKEGGLFYELKNSTRRDMVDLLMQNINVILMGDSNQNDLLLRNNNLMHLLINLNKSKFSENSDSVKTDKREDEIQDQEAKDKKHEATKIEVAGLKKEIDVLKSMIKEVTFDFVIKDVGNFLKEKESLSSDGFCCSALNWYLNAKIVSVKDEEYLSIYLHLNEGLNFDFSVKTNLSFVLTHPTDGQLNITRNFERVIECSNDAWGYKNFVTIKDLEKFIKHDKIRIRCNLKADKITSW